MPIGFSTINFPRRGVILDAVLSPRTHEALPFLLLATFATLTALAGPSAGVAAEGIATIISNDTICQEAGRYIGWPTIARTRDGELLVVFSGDRDAHICPWGITQMVRSRDNGQTWSQPETINNSPLDDRDAGIIQTKSGALVMNWFTSIVFANPAMIKWQNLSPELLESWQRHIAKVGPETRAAYLGSWTRRSGDGRRQDLGEAGESEGPVGAARADPIAGRAPALRGPEHARESGQARRGRVARRWPELAISRRDSCRRGRPAGTKLARPACKMSRTSSN